jgi:hypothetical protein
MDLICQVCQLGFSRSSYLSFKNENAIIMTSIFIQIISYSLLNLIIFMAISQVENFMIKPAISILFCAVPLLGVIISDSVLVHLDDGYLATIIVDILKYSFLINVWSKFTPIKSLVCGSVILHLTTISLTIVRDLEVKMNQNDELVIIKELLMIFKVSLLSSVMQLMLRPGKRIDIAQCLDCDKFTLDQYSEVMPAPISEMESHHLGFDDVGWIPNQNAVN